MRWGGQGPHHCTKNLGPTVIKETHLHILATPRVRFGCAAPTGATFPVCHGKKGLHPGGRHPMVVSTSRLAVPCNIDIYKHNGNALWSYKTLRLSNFVTSLLLKLCMRMCAGGGEHQQGFIK